MEPVARPGALHAAARRTCSPATSTRPRRCSPRRPPSPSATSNTDALVAQRVRARAVGDGPRAAGRRRPSIVRARARRHRRAPDARLRHERARLRRRGPARGAPRRPERGEPPAHAGDASPSDLHVRAAVPRRARSAAARQGVLGHRRPRRRLVTCCARSTTSCSTGRRSASSSTRSRSSAERSRRAAQARTTGGVAAHPGGASAAPVPADAPHDPRDRGAAVRVPQHRQLRGQLDLPEARRLLAQRRGATGDGDRSARRRSRAQPPDCDSKASSVSYPSAIASFGAAATTRGSPTMGMTPTSTSTISAAVAPALDRGVGLRAVGRDRAADRDQRGEADERQRLRVELSDPTRPVPPRSPPPSGRR